VSQFRLGRYVSHFRRRIGGFVDFERWISRGGYWISSGGFREGLFMGSPPGPVAGGATALGRRATGVARLPADRLCHAVAPRHSHRVVELAQRVRLPPRCRHPPTLHTFHGDHLVVRVLTPHKADVPQHSSTPTRTPLCTRFTFAMSEGPSEGPSEVCRTAPRAPPCHTTTIAPQPPPLPLQPPLRSPPCTV